MKINRTIQNKRKTERLDSIQLVIEESLELGINFDELIQELNDIEKALVNEMIITAEVPSIIEFSKKHQMRYLTVCYDMTTISKKLNSRKLYLIQDAEARRDILDKIRDHQIRYKELNERKGRREINLDIIKRFSVFYPSFPVKEVVSIQTTLNTASAYGFTFRQVTRGLSDFQRDTLIGLFILDNYYMHDTIQYKHVLFWQDILDILHKTFYKLIDESTSDKSYIKNKKENELFFYEVIAQHGPKELEKLSQIAKQLSETLGI